MRLDDQNHILGTFGSVERNVRRMRARIRRPRALRDVGLEKLESLCAAIGMASELESATRLFNLFSETWADRLLTAERPASDITDDGSPFEFSLALEDGRPELRMLTEAQGELASPASNWHAAWALTEQLGRSYGVDLERARSIADLFAPNADTRVFSLWHAGCLRPGAPVELKLYFNPAARGSDRVDATMDEAFARLGQSASLAWMREHALLRDEDHFVYFSLDLGAHAEARTKVYVAHRNACAVDVERVMSAAPTHVRGDALRFCDMMAGQRGPFEKRPLLTCMAFVGQVAEPRTVTLHLPIRCYVPSEQVALDRIAAFLPAKDADLHERAVHAMLGRPLSDSPGMQTYASFRRTKTRQERLTVYLSPELYHNR